MNCIGVATHGGSRREPTPGVSVGGLRVVRGKIGAAASRQAGGVLDNTTDIPTPVRPAYALIKAGASISSASAHSRRKCQSQDTKRIDRRASRWALRDGVQSITNNRRLAGCGRRATQHNPAIRLVPQDHGSSIAHYSNVQLCGSVHLCPVCSPRIRAERAKEINEALARWNGAHGDGSVALATLTLPHVRDEPLSALLPLVADGFSRLTKGKAWKMLRQEFGLAGYIRAHDITHGANGWHPHLHIVLLSEKPISGRAAGRLRAAVFRQWKAAVLAVGHRAPDGRACSVEVARNATAVSGYVAQVVAGKNEEGRPAGVAFEVARGDLKTSRRTGQRTVWEILASAVARTVHTADATVPISQRRDLTLWHEWESATRGIHAIQWSRGLRSLVGVADEKTDEEVVAIEVGGDVVYEFLDRNEWRAVVARKGARLRLLRAAERWQGRGVVRLVQCIFAGFRPVLAQEAAREYEWQTKGRTTAMPGGYIWMPSPLVRSPRRVRRVIRGLLPDYVRAELLERLVA